MSGHLPLVATPAMIDAGQRYIAAICGSDFPLDLGALYHIMAAQGIEAATAAETVKLGSVHESPVPKGCAQTLPRHPKGRSMTNSKQSLSVEVAS